MYGAAVRPCRRLALALLVLTGAACSPKKPPPDSAALHPEETATTVEAPTTSPPTTAALGEQVKTVEAAQRLLDLFAHLEGEAARLLLQKGNVDADVDKVLASVYVGQELVDARERFAEGVSSQFSRYVRPQPDVLFRAQDIVDARRADCVVVTGTADLRPRFTDPVPLLQGIFVMVVQDGMTPSGGNPTPWRLYGVGEPEQGTDLQAICPAL
jgi:hypothetical protein